MICCFDCFGGDYTEQKIEQEFKQKINELPYFDCHDLIRQNHVLNCTNHTMIDNKIWFTDSDQEEIKEISLEQAFAMKQKITNKPFLHKLSKMEMWMHEVGEEIAKPNIFTAKHQMLIEPIGKERLWYLREKSALGRFELFSSDNGK